MHGVGFRDLLPSHYRNRDRLVLEFRSARIAPKPEHRRRTIVRLAVPCTCLQHQSPRCSMPHDTRESFGTELQCAEGTSLSKRPRPKLHWFNSSTQYRTQQECSPSQNTTPRCRQSFSNSANSAGPSAGERTASSVSHDGPSGTFVAARWCLPGKESPGTLEHDGSMPSERTRERWRLLPHSCPCASLRRGGSRQVLPPSILADHKPSRDSAYFFFFLRSTALQKAVEICVVEPRC